MSTDTSKAGLQVDSSPLPTPGDTERLTPLRIKLGNLKRATEALEQAPTFLKLTHAQKALDEALGLLSFMASKIESLEKQLDEVTNGEAR